MSLNKPANPAGGCLSIILAILILVWWIGGTHEEQHGSTAAAEAHDSSSESSGSTSHSAASSLPDSWVSLGEGLVINVNSVERSKAGHVLFSMKLEDGSVYKEELSCKQNLIREIAADGHAVPWRDAPGAEDMCHSMERFKACTNDKTRGDVDATVACVEARVKEDEAEKEAEENRRQEQLAKERQAEDQQLAAQQAAIAKENNDEIKKKVVSECEAKQAEHPDMQIYDGCVSYRLNAAGYRN